MRATKAARRHRSALVLAYPAIADLPPGSTLRPYAVPETELIEQLDELERAGYEFVDLDGLLGALSGCRALARRAALITFDDCFEELLSVAAPVLADRSIPALAFAVAGRLGGTNDWDAAAGQAPLRLLGVEGLRQLERYGIEVGGHSVTHARLTELGP